jgi:hypothetical protein
MRPLTPSELTNFLDRFDDFKESEIRSLNIISPTNIVLSLVAQDKARDNDWITVELEFSDVSDAKLLDKNKFTYADMSDGITILHEVGLMAFGISKYKDISSVKESLLYIIAKSIKYNESGF